MSGLDLIKWLKTLLQVWGGGSFFIMFLGFAALIGAVAAYFTNNPLAFSWLLISSSFLIVLGLGKKYQERTTKTCIFIPDLIGSSWSHAPQPDGRKLTQFGLKGYVTNTTSQSLYLGKIKLLSPKSVRQHQDFIFTVSNGAVSNAPLSPGVRTEFNTSFFADGLLGVSGKPLTVKISVCDQFGHWHKVKFDKLRDPLSR